MTIKALETKLLSWYDAHQRVLPWRAVPGHAPNPYHVWLSEIMLQQTTVATVQDYFTRFVAQWPQVEDLAAATLDDVFHAWQGLGYYSRARNLHRCAQALVADFQGVLPVQESVLLTLPGIGSYTAAAIAAIAYDQPTVPVDGNVIRVFSRLFALQEPLPGVKAEVQDLAKIMVPAGRRGDFAQGLMDLGATICRPRNPFCGKCPLEDMCKARQQGIANQLPCPAPKAEKPRRYGIVFWVENEKKEILLEKRPDKGLLAGLMGLPTTLWRDTPWDWENDSQEALSQGPAGGAAWCLLPLVVHHTFTHFHLELKVVQGATTTVQKGVWSPVDQFATHALPTVMKKVIRGMGLGRSI